MHHTQTTVLSEFEDLLAKLLEQRPEMDRAAIEAQIKEKKEKIGGGFLTDQGALHLIAADLDVTLAESLKVEMGLKDLYVGAKEISIETKMLNLSEPKQYSRKDGTPFLLRTMTVYDGNTTASVKLWDEKANLPGLVGLKPGDLIKIIKAYVKSDLSGAPTINVGSGASVESADGESDIPSIDSITKDIGQVKEGEKDLVVSGTVEGPIGTIQFTNSKGQPGKGLKMGLKGEDGTVTRVVIWGKDESDLPAVISPNAKARLLGVRAKAGQQGLEVHGSESTIIEMDGSNEAQPVTARVISASESDRGRLLLGADEKGNLLRFTDTGGVTADLSEGDVMECMPTKCHGDSVTLGPDSFARKVDDVQSIPARAGLRTKITDIGIGKRYCIEAIILKIPDRRDIQTKTGDVVALSEMFVEDDTGQIWVKGWRNNAHLIDKCSTGEIVSITDLDAKAGLEGKTELFLGQFSSIAKKT